jgi:hypothetical protein
VAFPEQRGHQWRKELFTAVEMRVHLTLDRGAAILFAFEAKHWNWHEPRRISREGPSFRFF